MTYSNFLVLFIIPPTLAGLMYLFKSPYKDKQSFKEALYLLMGIAFVYTTPWDNYLVKTQVWSYEDHRVLFKIGYVPFEEYCFFVLQTLMTSCWCLFVLDKNTLQKSKTRPQLKHLVTVFLVVMWGYSVYCLGHSHTRYLGLILIWSLPVVILQWTIGGQHLLRNFKIYMACLIIPTAYLWTVDGYAIYKGIWGISESQTIGFKIFSLPFEEAVFFLVTNIMLIQGLLLYILLKKDFSKMLGGSRS